MRPIKRIKCAVTGHDPGLPEYAVGGRTITSCLNCEKELRVEFSHSVTAAKQEIGRRYGPRGRRRLP